MRLGTSSDFFHGILSLIITVILLAGLYIGRYVMRALHHETKEPVRAVFHPENEAPAGSFAMTQGLHKPMVWVESGPVGTVLHQDDAGVYWWVYP